MQSEDAARATNERSMLMMLGEVHRDIAAFGGRLDSLMRVLEGQAQRIERNELRIDRIEERLLVNERASSANLEGVKNRFGEQMSESEHRSDDKLAILSWKVAVVVGAASTIGFVAPIALRMVGAD